MKFSLQSVNESLTMEIRKTDGKEIFRWYLFLINMLFICLEETETCLALTSTCLRVTFSPDI